MSEERITLNDLKSKDQAPTTLKEVSLSEIRPADIKPDPVDEKFSEIFNNIDTAIERKKKDVDQIREEIYSEYYEEKLKEAIDGADEDKENNDKERLNEEFKDTSKNDEPQKKFTLKSSVEVSKTKLVIDDEDLTDDDEDTSREVQLNAMKTVIKEKIKPITNVIDLKSFTISQKPVSMITALKSAASDKKTINWVLPATGVSIELESFNGLDIQKLDPRHSSKNRFNTYRDIYSTIYNKLIDENKPESLEAWLKQVKFKDINHLFFAVYKGSFDGVNMIPYSCTKDKEVFMVNIPIDDMVKYTSDESKQKIQKLFEQDTTNINEYEVEMVQVSDEYVIGFRDPSIYNVIFESVILDETFTEKYSDLLSILVYMDAIYYINREDNNLQPIDLKQYPGNAQKTIKNKVVKYSQILGTLSSDQLQVINAYIDAINDRDEDMVYVLPEAKCPKCGTVIPEEEMTAETLLFTRHQLAGIANT